jgi:hypothetical protein
MKRPHTAYFEYFTDQVPKSTDWTWRVFVHPLKPGEWPSKELKGTAKSKVEAREAAQKAAAKVMEKYLIAKETK